MLVFSLSICNAQSITAVLPAGANPIAVAINRLSNKIYVPNSGSNTVTVIDGATNKTSTVPVGVEPFAIAVNQVTNKIYVANSGDNTLTVIDGFTNITSLIKLSASPGFVLVNSLDDKIYVSTGQTVTIVDGKTEATKTVPVQMDAMAVNPETHKLYGTAYFPHTLTVLDLKTEAVQTFTTLWPVAVAVNCLTNKVYIVNGDSPGRYYVGSVSVLDGKTNTLTEISTGGTSPTDLAIDELRNKIYVVNQGNVMAQDDGTVTMIDGKTNEFTTVTVGQEALSIGADVFTNKIYVANYLSNSVSVIDGATSHIIKTLTYGTESYVGPFQLAVNPLTNRIYTANYYPTYSTGTVTVIKGAK